MGRVVTKCGEPEIGFGSKLKQVRKSWNAVFPLLLVPTCLFTNSVWEHNCLRNSVSRVFEGYKK